MLFFTNDINVIVNATSDYIQKLRSFRIVNWGAEKNQYVIMWSEIIWVQFFFSIDASCNRCIYVVYVSFERWQDWPKLIRRLPAAADNTRWQWLWRCLLNSKHLQGANEPCRVNPTVGTPNPILIIPHLGVKQYNVVSVHEALDRSWQAISLATIERSRHRSCWSVWNSCKKLSGILTTTKWYIILVTRVMATTA